MSDASVVALVPVAGRAGLGIAHGAPLVVHAVRKLIGAAVDRVIVLPESEFDSGLVAAFDPAIVHVMSGTTLHECAAAVAARPGTRVILVHDPLRAFTPTDLVDRVVQAVLTGGRPVVPVLPCSDTVKQLNDVDVVIDTPDRAGLRVVQTPVGYPAALVASGAVVADGAPVGARTVLGDPMARRLAGPVDLAMIDGGPA